MNSFFQITNPVIKPELRGAEGTDFFAKLLPNLVTTMLVIAAIVFLFVILVTGISWMMSGGDKQAAESARSRLTNAIIGLIIVFGVFALAKFIEIVVGVDIINIDLGILRL